MLIDHYLPHSEATQVQEVSVHASPTVTYGAIRETNLSDPLIDMLFTIRELPVRLARRLRGESRRRPSPAPVGRSPRTGAPAAYDNPFPTVPH